ncbi:hypothetical protein BaRGS_00004566 [Batillaria attramentaria]|uniref:Uncharacterized protein n=1 Tax=Batillaria attramentaria TaxID=370345 RepID=A0ABD0LXY2_9CAEN
MKSKARCQDSKQETRQVAPSLTLSLVSRRTRASEPQPPTSFVYWQQVATECPSSMPAGVLRIRRHACHSLSFTAHCLLSLIVSQWASTKLCCLFSHFSPWSPFVRHPGRHGRQ